LSGFTAFFLLFFSPVFLSGRFFGDAVDQVIEALPSYLGHHPLWDPRTMLGYPMFANPVNAYWYPLGLLRFAPHSYDVYELLAFVVAACGAYTLVRSLTASLTAGLIGGLVYSLSGFMIGHIGHIDIVQPAAWVPWLFWALNEQRRSNGSQWVFVGATSLALCILGGQPQPAVYTLYLALVFLVVFARSAGVGSSRFLTNGVLTIAFGVGLAAVSLVPAAELAAQSVRASLNFADFNGFATPPVQLPIRLFFPYLLGQTVMWPYRFSAMNVGSFAEMSNFVGITSIAIAIVAIRSYWRDVSVRFWLFVAVGALLLSTGNYLGIATVTYHLPLYNEFRAPGRNAMELALAACALCGYGIAAIEKRDAPLRVVVVSCAAAAVALVVSLLLLWANSNLFTQIIAPFAGNAALSLDLRSNAALLIPVLALCIGTVALIAFSRRPEGGMNKAFMVFAVALDLGAFAWFSYWNWGAFSPALLAPPPYAAVLRQSLAPKHQRLYSIPTDNPRSGIAPNLNLVWDVPSARGYTPLELARTNAYFRTVGTRPSASDLRSDATLLDEAGIRYLVMPSPTVMASRTLPGWRQVGNSSGDVISENLHALPRIWIVHHVIDVPSSRALADAQTTRYDPLAIAEIEGPRSLDLPQVRGAADRATVEDLAADDFRIDVSCASACYVVTSDTTYPGWRGLVDGRETPIYATDYALRGIFVPSGRHTVDFQYRPDSLVIGAGITCASFIGLILFTLAPLAVRARPSATA
jgi:hypothetical protein